MTIREVREASPGVNVSVAGVATTDNGTFRSSTFEYGFAVQDSSAGIYVELEAVPEHPIAIGCNVEVRGVRGTLAKLVVVKQVEILALDCEPLATVPAPLEVSTGSVGPANEGLLVTVEGNVTSMADDGQYGYKVFVDDGSQATLEM